MYQVYKKSSGGCKVVILEVETEKEAIDFCEDYGWELEDGNGFWWELDYREI